MAQDETDTWEKQGVFKRIKFMNKSKFIKVFSSKLLFTLQNPSCNVTSS